MIAVMMNPTDVIERECAMPQITQSSVALSVALAIRGECHGEKADWPRINAAIRNRWPKGLDRVKKMAWKLVKGRSEQEGR